MRRARAFAATVSATALALTVLATGTRPTHAADLDVAQDRLELGRRLFFDPAASRLGVRSCADCHDPDHGWSDAHVHSEDARGATRRHSQSLIDCAEVTRFHSDGEFGILEDLISSRLKATAGSAYYGGSDEEVRPLPRPPDADGISPDFVPGGSSRFVSDFDSSDAARAQLSIASDSAVPEPADALADAGRYRETLGGTRNSGGRLDRSRMVAALAAFCRSIRSGSSPYDRFAAGDVHALSPSATRGLALFTGRGRCASCHLLSGKRPPFTDGKFHCTDVELRHSREPVGLSPSDAGALIHRLGPLASFRTPSLRDVARRAPYMHDGRFATLEEAIAHYATPLPSGPKPTIDPLMPRDGLEDGEVADIAEFLRALTSEEAPGKPDIAWNRRAQRTTLHVVDADGHPLPDREVTLVPCGEALPGTFPPREIRLRTDRKGTVSYEPPATTHVRLLLPDGMRPKGGTWIPDTCSEATIALPVSGTARLHVVFPPGEPAPPLLVFQHHKAQFFAEHRLPTTTLTFVLQVMLRDGRRNALYAAPLRTDVPPDGRLRVPMPATVAELHYLTLGTAESVAVGAP